MTLGRETYCRCLYYSANALARKITQLAEREFAPTGLPPSLGFVVMSVIRMPGITAGEIARIMQIQPSTVTRFVDKLEKSGYLRRRSDGKFTRVHPTVKASHLNPALHSAWRNLYRRYAAILGEEESMDLTAAIFKASSSLEAG